MRGGRILLIGALSRAVNVRYPFPVTRYPLPAARCPLPVTRHPQCAARCPLPAACYPINRIADNRESGNGKRKTRDGRLETGNGYRKQKKEPNWYQLGSFSHPLRITSFRPRSRSQLRPRRPPAWLRLHRRLSLLLPPAVRPLAARPDPAAGRMPGRLR